MRKILFLIFFNLFSSSLLFAQQKDTLVLVVGKQPGEYLSKRSNFFARLHKSLENVIQTTPEYFFLDNAGIKSEFVKCYFDTSFIKTIGMKDTAVLMTKRMYIKQQADFLKLNKRPFTDIVGNDAEGKPFAIHDFLGKTTLIGVNNHYIGMFFEPMYKDLDSVRQAFPDINVVMLSGAMTYEVKQAIKEQSYAFPIVPDCKEVLEANVSSNFQLPYYVVLDKNGVVQDMLFIYDSSGVFSFVDGYNFYNLKTLEKAQVKFSYFSELKKILSKK
jgi:hypothetical protein